MKSGRRSLQFGLTLVAALTGLLWASWTLGWLAVFLGWQAPLIVVIMLSVFTAPVLLAVGIAVMFAVSLRRSGSSSPVAADEPHTCMAAGRHATMAVSNS